MQQRQTLDNHDHHKSTVAPEFWQSNFYVGTIRTPPYDHGTYLSITRAAALRASSASARCPASTFLTSELSRETSPRRSSTVIWGGVEGDAPGEANSLIVAVCGAAAGLGLTREPRDAATVCFPTRL